MKIKEELGFANGFPAKLIIELGEKERAYIQEEDVYYLCFQFCSWLETRPKGAVGGATTLLRAFLTEKGLLNAE